MKSVYRMVKDVWQLVPAPVADRLRQVGVVRLLLGTISDALISRASHEEIYDKRYYDYVDRTAVESACAMASELNRRFLPNTVVDVGCGSGALLAELRQHGPECLGLEYSDAGLARAKTKGVEALKFDLEDLASLGTFERKFDLATSFEVAEHLPERLAQRYVNFLCRLSDVVVITAATPGQGGLDHVNEQPHSYWIERFSRCGFNFDEKGSLEIRDCWRRSNVHRWYSENAMVFRRSE